MNEVFRIINYVIENIKIRLFIDYIIWIGKLFQEQIRKIRLTVGLSLNKNKKYILWDSL